MPDKPVTAETLRADRERRQRERDRLAASYDKAARLLRGEAETWRRERP